MKCFLLIIVSVFFTSTCLSQNERLLDTEAVDSLYKEDQFYIGVTYNILGSRPSGVSQNGFSSGFHFGFSKDIPINKKRNVAIGLGLGLSFNSFNQELLISENATKATVFSVLNGTETVFSKNKFYMHMLEAPLEFRWRTSTATDYKFWRIYTGLKFGYVFANASKYEGAPQNIRLNNSDAFNNFQYGLTFSAGYNTWNFYFYYALNPIFKDGAQVNGEQIDIKALKVGLMFYIL